MSSTLALTGRSMSLVDLEATIDRLPRTRLGHLPTPIEHLPRLSKTLGGPDIFVKRDDCTGLAFGGNKVRQHEFILPLALAAGADTIVTGGGVQSNWCRQASAAAAKLGLNSVLVLAHGPKGRSLQGNLLLDRLLGAEVVVVEGNDLEALVDIIEAKAADLRLRGCKPFVVAWSDIKLQALGAVGYVNAFAELQRQIEALNIRMDHLYFSGAGATHAGLALGAHVLGEATRVIGIGPIHWREPMPAVIARIASAAAETLGLPHRLASHDISNDQSYIGLDYGVITNASREAIKLVARTEGLILDPVYTGKAMAGLIDHIQKGRILRGQNVVFLHSGGTPALFAYADDLQLELDGDA